MWTKKMGILFLVVALAALVTGVLLPVSAGTIELKVQIGPDTPDNKAENEATMAKIARFEAANPGIKCVPVPFTYTTRQDFFIKQASRTAPDVLDVWATECPMLADNGWIVPLDDYLAAWDKIDWINPSAFDSFRYKGQIYGVPLAGYIKHIIYNKRMFAEKNVPEPSLDWTWDDFIDAAVKLTDKDKGIAGFVPMTKGGEGGWTLTDFIYQAGGEIMVYEDGKYTAVFDSPEAVAAVQFMKDMRWKYDVLPANWLNDWTDVYNVFGAEQAAMVFDADWGRNIAVNGQGMDPNDIGVALMPKGPGPKGRHMGVQGGRFLVLNSLADPGVQEAAWKWLTFELWDEAEIEGIRASAGEYRAQGQYRAHFEYLPLKPDSPYYRQLEEVYAENADVFLSWGSEEFLVKLPETAHPEPPVEAQVLYAEFLAPIVQEVLSNRRADPAELLNTASVRFQNQYLDDAI